LSRISSVQPGSDREWGSVYIGVGLTTLATLILELSLTRIFSVVFYYHFAFLAISIALFGLGAGGVFSYVVAGRKGPTFSKLGAMALANAIAIVIALTFVMTRTGTPGNATLALVYFASAFPFFLAGAIISLAISETIQRVERVYFFDLIGASGGCLALIPLLNLFGGPNTVIASAVLFAVSAAVWYNLDRQALARVAGVMLALLLVALMFVNGAYRVIDVRWAKGQALPDEKFVQWNSFSRIALAPERGTDNHLIIIDADASTGIPPYDWDHLDDRTRNNLLHQGPGFPYLIRPGAKTLVIGPGGGWDVGRALASGSKDITGVEINPIIARTIMQKRFPDLSHRLYFRPEVHLNVEDGRSFVRRSTDRYQVIQATLVDTWASTAAGAFALSENNLYTSDAFSDYLSHLTDDGFLAFTRWGFEPPRESLRLLSLAIDALDRFGEKQPWKHVIIARENASLLQHWGAQDTVLISRKPFSTDDIARARVGIAQGGAQILYVPGDAADSSAFAKLLRSPDTDAFYENYSYDVRPVDDDRPFFFYTVQPRDIWNFVSNASHESADFKINRAVPLLFNVVAVSLLATAVILVLPRIVLGSRLPRERNVFGFLFYFLFIGAGYILIQVALIQKFVLFLGHPTYALTVIIFSMLVASGLGSFFSRRIISGDDARWRMILAAVPVLITALAFTSGPLTTALVGLPLPVKMILTSVLIIPAAFLMGMPFPTGLGRLESMHSPSVRWAWSLNAASSVLGSAGAIFLAIYIGLRLTLIAGGLCYLGALATLFLAARRAPTAVMQVEHSPTL
jgi:hypothetical protein